MATEQQIDRSVLAGKDRDELHTIAGAIGVKAATRMRKADLIDAILAAANGGEPAATETTAAPASKPRRVRSARASQAPADDLAALAEEENALGADTPVDEPPMPRPRTRRAAPAPAPPPAERPEPPETADTDRSDVDDRDDAGEDAAHATSSRGRRRRCRFRR